MATFLDLTFEELMKNAPKVVRQGFTGTETMVFQHPEYPSLGIIVELNNHQKVLGTWVIKAGNAYRITPGKVLRMPLMKNDPKPIRRFCRSNGIALTRIQYVERDEKIYFGRAHHHGDSNYRSINASEPAVCLKWVDTIENPARVWKILVVKGEEPATYDEFVTMVRDMWEERKGVFLPWGREEVVW